MKHCEYCDDTGDVHWPDGEYRGRCICQAGTLAPMTTDNIALAQECGARALTNGVEHRVTFDDDQLSQFVQRIRSEALEEAANLAHDWPAPIDGRIPLEIARAIRALDRLGGDGEVTR